MKEITLAIILISITSFSSALKAQDSTYIKKNEIGINTMPILNQIFSSQGAYYVPPESSFELMFKRNNGRKQAWRMGINLSFSSNKVEPVLKENSLSSSRNSFNLVLGSEWKSIISKRWIWFSGGDIIPSYYRYSNESKNEERILNRSDETNKGLTLRPFFGLRFNINSRLYIATEASLNLRYGKRELSSMYTIGEQTTERHTISTDFSLNLNPAAGLYFFYKF